MVESGEFNRQLVTYEELCLGDIVSAAQQRVAALEWGDKRGQLGDRSPRLCKKRRVPGYGGGRWGGTVSLIYTPNSVSFHV